MSIIGTALSPNEAIHELFISALHQVGAKVHLITDSHTTVSAVCADSDIPATVTWVHAAFSLDRDLHAHPQR